MAVEFWAEFDVVTLGLGEKEKAAKLGVPRERLSRAKSDPNLTTLDLVARAADVFKELAPFVKRFAVLDAAERMGASTSRDVSRPPEELEEIVRQATKEARRALEPTILPRLPRPSAMKRLLPAIERSIRGPALVSAILGEGGIGKTTILGELVDRLDGVPGIGIPVLALCTRLPRGLTSGSQLDLALGRLVSRREVPLTTLVGSLRQPERTPIVVMDTVDWVTTEQTAGPLVELLERIVAGNQVPVVLTCRQLEFDLLRGGLGAAGAPVADRLDPYGVPTLVESEITHVVRAFLELRSDRSTEQIERFTSSVLALSSNRRSVRAVTEHPLRLAMLCDLYGAGVAVPEDVSVDRLYQEYWSKRVVGSRRGAGTSPQSLAKETFCLDLAAHLFRRSQAIAQEAVHVADILVNPTDAATSAVDELLSDGVLRREPTGAVRFFHHTFLEFATAGWLLRRGTSELVAVLERLRGATEGERMQWWPLVRQILVLADTAQRRDLCAKLDLTSLGAFRAAAMAAGTSSDRELLESLASSTTEFPDLEGALLDGIDCLPPSSYELAISCACSVLRTGSTTALVNGTRSLAARLSTLDRGVDIGPFVLNAMLAIEARPDPGEVKKKLEPHALKALLEPVLDRLRETPHELLLARLRERYRVCRDAVAHVGVRLHCSTKVKLETRRELLEIALRQEPLEGIHDELSELALYLLSELVDLDSWDGLTWPFDLPEEPAGGDAIKGRVLGRVFAQRPELVDRALPALFSSASSPKILRLALRQGAASGAAAVIAQALTKIPEAVVDRSHAHVLSLGLRELVGELMGLPILATIRTWIKPIAERLPQYFRDDHPIFENSREPELAQIERHVRGLSAKSENAVQAHARSLEDLAKAGATIDPEVLVAALESQYPGVRERLMRALGALVARHAAVAPRVEGALAKAWARVREDVSEPVFVAFVGAFSLATWKNKEAPQLAFEVTEAAIERFGVHGNEYGLGRPLVELVDGLARKGDAARRDPLATLIVRFVRCVDVYNVGGASQKRLVQILVAASADTLRTLAEEPSKVRSHQNLVALSSAIRRKKSTPLFNALINHPDLPASVRQSILRYHGERP